MPLADGDKSHFEIIVKGTTAALGGVSQSTVTPLHYLRTSFAANYSAAALITAFHALCKTPWKDAVSLSWLWDTTEVRCIDSPMEQKSTIPVAEAGAVAGDMLPAMVAGVLGKLTALRGRSYQGRTYIAGIAESNTTGNAHTAGGLALFAALAVVLKTGLTDANGLTFIPCVLSRKLSNLQADPSSVVMTPITNIMARSVLGRLSSRKSLVI